MGVYGIYSILSETAKVYYLEGMFKKQSHDNSMSVKDAERYYNLLIKQCRGKAKTKEQIDDCIKVLKECVDQMSKAKAKAELDHSDSGRLEYAISSILPLNSIQNLVQRNDWEKDMDDMRISDINLKTPIYVDKKAVDTAEDVADNAIKAASVAKTAVDVATTTNPVGIAKTGISFVYKYATYTKMLEKNIRKTNEAIDYLERKRKEL